MIQPRNPSSSLTHIACFKVSTGDVEDAPALDPLSTYEVFEKDGAVYIKTDEDTLKANRRVLNVKCSSVSNEQVLVIGGCVLLVLHVKTIAK